MIKIAPDKWKHFIVGVLMGMLFQFVAGYFFPDHLTAGVMASLFLVIVISYGFELFSLITKKGHYDIFDAIAAVIGGILGMALALSFVLVVHLF